MSTPRGFRDRSDQSLLTLIGELPELIKNLVVAEIDAVKGWVSRSAKNAGIGAGLIVVALVVLFWSVPALGAFVIAGLSSWWPVWLSALVVFGAMVLLAVILALLSLVWFRRIRKGNPVDAVKQDAMIVKEAVDER